MGIIIFTNRLIPSGADDFVPGPFALIRPRAIGDIGLIMHALTHVAQFWRTWGLFSVLWLVSPKLRLQFEAEAYAAQARENGVEYIPEFATILASEIYSLKNKKWLPRSCHLDIDIKTAEAEIWRAYNA